MDSKIITPANILTFIRIALVPLYLWLFGLKSFVAVLLALIVFVIAAVTDLYDGRLARSRKEITRLGKFLDPLADKFLVIGALVQFWMMGLVNIWLVSIIIVRDIWVTAIRVYAIAGNRELKTSKDAKLKTTIQLTVVITTIVFTGARAAIIEYIPDYNGVLIEIDRYRLFFNFLLVVAVVFTLYSWFNYIRHNRVVKV